MPGAEGLKQYANSVVSTPTIFPFAKGGAFGLMGEAGAEAIMPLERDSRGHLGVIASDLADRAAAQGPTINIQVINQTGTPVSAEMRRQPTAGGGMDTTIILKSLDEGLARKASAGDSKLARSMQSTYGLNDAAMAYRR